MEAGDRLPELPLLEEHYRLGPVLGSGGFGEVRAGVHLEEGTEVAIKLSHRELEASQTSRVLREARLARALHHPGLVPLLDLARTRRGALALVYQRIQGRTLEEFLSEAPPAERWLPWARDLARALDALHGANLIHRDLKPENVMIDGEGRARLLDYGLLRGTEEGARVTATGVLLGTPVTMAPEIFLGEPCTPASDRYGLASVLYRLHTGRYPLEGGPGEIMRAFLSRDPKLLEGALAALPPRLRPVLERGLAPRPGDRPGSCCELVELLEEAEAGGKATVEREGAFPFRSLEPTRVLPEQAVLRAEAEEFEETTGVPRSRSPRGRPRWGWRAGLASAVLLGLAWVLASPGAAPERVAPAAPENTPAPRTRLPTREALEEIEGLLGARMDSRGRRVPDTSDAFLVLGRDPRTWHLTRQHLPVCRSILEAFLDEVDPRSLGDDEREDLVRVDGILQDYDLAELFAPYLEIEPRVDPGLWEPSRFPALEDFPVLHGGEGLEGWATTAQAYLVELAPFYLAREKAVLESSEDFGKRFGDFLTLLNFSDFDSFLERALQGPEGGRRLLAEWLEPGELLTRRFLLAAGRALEEDLPHRQELARYFYQAFYDWGRPFVHRAGTLPGFPAMIGRRPRSPAAAIFASRVAQEWRHKLTFCSPSPELLVRETEKEEALLRNVAEALADGRVRGAWVEEKTHRALVQVEERLHYYREKLPELLAQPRSRDASEVGGVIGGRSGRSGR